MLELESLTLAYGARTVLQSVSLRVERGEVLALIGPNGSGKSTLIRAASGVLRPRAGRVLIDGEDLRRLSAGRRARRVAVVPQAARVPDSFTALETVLLGRTPYLGWLGREGESDHRAAREAMERTSTADLARRRLGEISGGERQLVLIARALAQSAPVLLLDEPTSNLDLAHQAQVLRLARSLAREAGHSVLLALHDLNLAAQHADRVALLSEGGLRAAGAPAEVLVPDVLARAYGVPVEVFPHPRLGSPVIFAERS